MVINHLLNGMILQVGTHFVHKKSPSDVNPRTFAHQTTEVRETSGTLGYADPLYIRSGFWDGVFLVGGWKYYFESGRIPDNHLGCIKTLWIMVKTTNLNRFSRRISEPSTVCAVFCRLPRFLKGRTLLFWIWKWWYLSRYFIVYNILYICRFASVICLDFRFVWLSKFVSR